MLFNVSSVYSLLNSTLKIPEYVSLAKEYGYTSIGLADESVLHGSLEFYLECQKNNLKSLIGLHLKIRGIHRQDELYSFLLYAISNKGYKQLIHISRLLTSPNYSDNDIWNYLIATDLDIVYISLGKESEIEKSIFLGQDDIAKKTLSNLQNIFGHHRVFLGINIYPFNHVEITHQIGFANENQIKCVLAQKTNMLYKDDAFSLRILEAIRENVRLDASAINMKGTTYLFSYDELKVMLDERNLSNVLYETRNLAEHLNVTMDINQNYLPKFQIDTHESSEEYLSRLAHLGLKKIDKNNDIEYQKRLDHELNTIFSMGFSDYFLIVWEIIDYCRKNYIRVGPGRGSAAGSLVSYLLNITSVDPIEYNLLFERFLNPERRNMPDIDIDIADDKRDKVLKYISKKYGYQQVAQIVTMGTFGAKQSIRDTLRVMGADTQTLKSWSSKIPSDANQLMTLDRAIKLSHPLKQLVESNQYNQDIFQAAKTIEGIPRNHSTHAAAVVINDFPLGEIIPVKERENNLLITQFDMYGVEKIGLLKMDFLGLRNLTILDHILNDVKQKNDNFEIEQININDKETIEIFKQANTLGVFQFESDGIRNVLRKLKPENFEDIVAVNALYRPGPMKQIDNYILRKHGKEPVTYIHEILEPILRSTYGIIVYQEQVMEIVVNMAGFSLGEADILRRAMSKKDVEMMNSQRTHFISGSIKNGFNKQEAELVFQYIYDFSNYGFNRAHAVVYSTLAFQLAYCKAHYPASFYKGILNYGNSNRITYEQYLVEARKELILLPIDINRSQANFSVENGLRVGLSAIKGIRNDFIYYILDDRRQKGNYTSINNFLQRMPKKYLKDEILVPLVYVGAFDNLDYNRKTIIDNLDKILKSLDYSGLSYSLFEDLAPKITVLKDYSGIEKLKMEKEWLGFSISGHPLDQYQNYINSNSKIISLDKIDAKTYSKITTIGMVSDIKVIRTKNNQLMAFVELSNQYTQIDLVLFPKIYQEYQNLLNINQIIVVEGKLEVRNNKHQIIGQNLSLAELIDHNKEQQILECFIRINNYQQDLDKIKKLQNLALENSGLCSVILVDSENKSILLSEKYKISHNFRVQEILKQIFGSNNVIFQGKKY